MSTSLIRLSNTLGSSIPQIVLFVVCRKIISCTFLAIVTFLQNTRLLNNRIALEINREYNFILYHVNQAWAILYISLIVYVLYDCITNLSDILNCDNHTSPRPIGIYCAIALYCIVFTNRLSVSTLSIVVLLCAKDTNSITGLASVINFGVWANVNGLCVFMSVCSAFSCAKYLFCGQTSDALLFTSSFIWLFIWGSLNVVYKISRYFDVKKNN
jgi:hypothetical protein